MTTTPRLPIPTASLTTAVPVLTRIIAAIPIDQPIRVEFGNYGYETTIRVQLVSCGDQQIGIDAATRLGLNPDPVARAVSDKSTEFTWSGDVDGWAVTILRREYSTALNI